MHYPNGVGGIEKRRSTVKEGEIALTLTYIPTVSIIIPVLNAEREIGNLLDTIKKQAYPISEIIVVDSGSEDRTVEICRKAESVHLIEIERKDFDHGRTRDMAFRESKGEVVVFLTQDAIPANEHFLERLIAPLEDPKVAVSTGRQIPKKNATKMEKLVRLFNYPSDSNIRSKEDIPQLGIKTFFCSDVCAAYKRHVYLKLGGFDYPIRTNEDMFFAAKAINAGYSVAYVGDAEVFHSHNFTLKQQYKRNYIQGYEIEKHRIALNNVEQKSEGIKLVKFVSKELLKHGELFSFIHFGLDCCARLMGSRAGRKKARDNT